MALTISANAAVHRAGLKGGFINSYDGNNYTTATIADIGGKLCESLTRVVEPTLHGEILEKGAYRKQKAEEESQAEVEKEMEEIELPDDGTESE